MDGARVLSGVEGPLLSGLEGPVPSDVEGPVPSDVEGCPVCGLDPCGCGIELPAADADDEALIFPSVEAAAAAIAAHQVAANPLAWDGPAMIALVAFLDRRDALQAKHGERAVTDRSRPPASLARDLKERACALVDRLQDGRAAALAGAEGAERAALALHTLATIGALALALHERLRDAAGTEA